MKIDKKSAVFGAAATAVALLVAYGIYAWSGGQQGSEYRPSIAEKGGGAGSKPPPGIVGASVAAQALELSAAEFEKFKVEPVGEHDFKIQREAALEDQRDRIPILVLTSRKQIAERIQAFDMGAECLAAPFAMPELVAKVRALLCRVQPTRATRIVYGPLIIDRAARRAYLQGDPLHLMPREWALLEVLLGRADGVVPKEEISRAISGAASCCPRTPARRTCPGYGTSSTLAQSKYEQCTAWATCLRTPSRNGEAPRYGHRPDTCSGATLPTDARCAREINVLRERA